MSITSKQRNSYNVRSISFPATRLHPTTQRVHELLNKLKSLEASSMSTETICLKFSGLAELYESIQDLLNLPLTHQALAQTKFENWINELLEGSVNYLDVCSKTRDSVLSLKQSITEVQSSLRRSKITDSSFNGYVSNRKIIKKETLKCLFLLKQVSAINGGLESDLVRVFEETNSITNSIFCSLLLFLSPPLMKKIKPKTSNWSIVSKLVKRGTMVSVSPCEEEDNHVNELEVVDVALCNVMVMKDCEIQSGAEMKLEKLEGVIEGFEKGLDCLFKRLISTRVSLLNILSL